MRDPLDGEGESKIDEGGCSASPCSSGSGGTPRHHKGGRRGSSRLDTRRSSIKDDFESGLEAQSDDKQGRNRGGTGGGMGLSADDLQELHKTDPKRVKRILANRSSAARSKVRKLRYIAELESKASALQEEADGMQAEMSKLQEQALSLSHENEELFGQAYNLQDQVVAQGKETEQLMQQVSQLQAAYEPSLAAHALPVHSVHSLAPLRPGQPAPSIMSPFAAAGDFSQVIPQLPPLAGSPHPTFNSSPHHSYSISPHPSLASSNTTMRSSSIWPTVSFTHSEFMHAGLDRHSLTQRRHSDVYPGSELTATVSGLSCTTQDSQFTNPDMDPTLLELLRMTELGPRQEAHQPSLPFLPPLRVYGPSRDDSFAALGGLSPADAYGGRTLYAPSSMQQHGLPLRPGGLASLPSFSGSGGFGGPPLSGGPGTRPPSSGFEPPGEERPRAREGLALWPRHLSDPQGFHRRQHR